LHQVQATASDNQQQQDDGGLSDGESDASKGNHSSNLLNTVDEALKADSDQLMADTVRKFHEALRTIHETNENSEHDDSNRSRQFMTIQRQESIMEEIPYIATMMTMPSFGQDENLQEDMEEESTTMKLHELDIEPQESVMEVIPRQRDAAMDMNNLYFEKGYCEHSPEEEDEEEDEGPEILVRDNKKSEADSDEPIDDKLETDANFEPVTVRDSLRRTLRPRSSNPDDPIVNESRDVADERAVEDPVVFETGYETDRESPPITEATVSLPDNCDRVVPPISTVMHSLFQSDSSDEGDETESDDDMVHLNEQNEASSMINPDKDVDLAEILADDTVPEVHARSSKQADVELNIAEQGVTPSAPGGAILSDDHSMMTQPPLDGTNTEKSKEATFVDKAPLRQFEVVIPNGFGRAEVELLLDGAESCTPVDNQGMANTAILEIQENAVNLVNKASRMAAEILAWIESEGQNQLDFEEVQKDASNTATENGIVFETINRREIGQIALFESEQDSLRPEPVTSDTFEQAALTGTMTGNKFVEEILKEESSSARDVTEKEIQCMDIGITSEASSFQTEEEEAENATKDVVEDIQIVSDQENEIKAVSAGVLLHEDANESLENEEIRLEIVASTDSANVGIETEAELNGNFHKTEVEMIGNFHEQRCLWFEHEESSLEVKVDTENVGIEVQVEAEDMELEPLSCDHQASDARATSKDDVKSDAVESETKTEGAAQEQFLCKEENSKIGEKAPCEAFETERNVLDPAPETNESFGLVDVAMMPAVEETLYPGHEPRTKVEADTKAEGLDGELKAEETVHEQVHSEEVPRGTMESVILTYGEAERNIDAEEKESFESSEAGRTFLDPTPEPTNTCVLRDHATKTSDDDTLDQGDERKIDDEKKESFEPLEAERNVLDPTPESNDTRGLQEIAMKPSEDDTLNQGDAREIIEKLRLTAKDIFALEFGSDSEMEEGAKATLEGNIIHLEAEPISQESSRKESEAFVEADADAEMKQEEESDKALKTAKAIKSRAVPQLQADVHRVLAEEANKAGLEIRNQARNNKDREEELRQGVEAQTKKSEEPGMDRLEAEKQARVIKAREEQEREEVEARMKKAEEADKARLAAQKLARLAAKEAARFKREKEIEEKARLKAEAEIEQAREETRRAEAARMRAEEETARLKVKIEERMAEEIEVQMTETAHVESERLRATSLMTGDDEASQARLNAAVVLRKVHEAEERRKTHESPSVANTKNSRVTTKLSSTRSVTSRASKQSDVGSKFPSGIPRFSSTSSNNPKEVLKQSPSYQSEFFSCGGNPGSVSSEDYLTVYMRSSEAGEDGTIDLSDLSRDEEYDLATLGSFSTQWSSGTRKYIFESTPAFAKHAKALHDQRRDAKNEAGDEDGSTGDQGSLNSRYWSRTCYAVGAIAIMGFGGTMAFSPKYREKIASFNPMFVLNLVKASWASAWCQINPELILKCTMASMSTIREQIQADRIVSYAKASLTLVRDQIQPAVIKKIIVESLASLRDNLHIEKIVRVTIDSFMKAKDHLRIGA
jgi:hypothetical protein